MRIIPAAVALCCTLLLAACFPPVTKTPIGGSAANPDPALLGLWKGNMANSDSREPVYFHFIRKKDGGMTVLMVSADKKNEDGALAAVANATKVGGNRFLNARLIPLDNAESADDDGPDGTIPVLYRFEGRRLTLYLMNEDATKDAIKAKKITGTVEPGQFGDATITADQQELDRFVTSGEGQKLFSDKFAVLTRMD